MEKARDNSVKTELHATTYGLICIVEDYQEYFRVIIYFINGKNLMQWGQEKVCVAKINYINCMKIETWMTLITSDKAKEHTEHAVRRTEELLYSNI